MANHNFITLAWEKEERSLFTNLSITRHQPTRDSVHDLRVSVKKLKAYLVLNQEISGLEFKQTFRSIKKYFDIAGKYRDTQMAMSMAKKHGEKHDGLQSLFEKHLQSLLPIAEYWTRQGAIDLDIADISRLRLLLNEGSQQSDNKDLRWSLRSVVEKKLQEVKSLSPGFKDNAHQIRKILKMVYYWLLIAPPPPLLSTVEMKSLDELLDLLGKWQDHMVLSEKLKRFRKDLLVKGTKIYEHAKDFEDFIKKEANELLSKAENETLLIRDHIFP